MQIDEFNRLVEDVVAEIVKRLQKKGTEYAKDTDRLYNFKRAAEQKRCSTIQALDGMWVKQRVSMADIIEGTLPNDAELVWEKALDNICYTILAMGVLQENRNIEAESLVGIRFKCTPIESRDSKVQMPPIKLEDYEAKLHKVEGRRLKCGKKTTTD